MSPSLLPSPPTGPVSLDRACADLATVEAATPLGWGDRAIRPARESSLVALLAGSSPAADGQAEAGGNGRGYDLVTVSAGLPGRRPTGISALTRWQVSGPPLATLSSSPDGRALALTFFGSDECTEPVVVRFPGASVLQPFASTAARPVIPIGWAPAGRRLAAIVSGVGLAIWDESTGRLTVPALPCFACGQLASAAWSGDGSRIEALFTRPCPARDGCDWFGLATFSVGAARVQPFAGWEVQDPRWLDEVQHGEGARLLGWADASHVALALGSRVAVVPVDPSGPGRFVALRAPDAVLSPDGRLIAWPGRDGARVVGVEVADISGGTSHVSRRVWSTPAGVGIGGTVSLAWAPDSSRLGIGLRDQIWVGGVDGGFVRVPGAARPIAALTW